jgi:hypothetical protein
MTGERGLKCSQGSSPHSTVQPISESANLSKELEEGFMFCISYITQVNGAAFPTIVTLLKVSKQ